MRGPSRYHISSEEESKLTYVVKGTDGKFYGPADLQTLNQWAAEGRIVADTVLVEQGTNRQAIASDTPGLQHHFSPAFRPQPPQPGTAAFQPQQNPYQPTQSPGQYNPFANPPNPSNYPRPGSTPYNAYPAQRKSKLVAALLAFFLGGLGIHRFYLGHNAIGITMLLITMIGGPMTCGLALIVTSVWAIVDFVLILTGQLKDISGQPLE